VIYLYFDRWRERIERWTSKLAGKKAKAHHGEMEPAPVAGD
jgi:multidrug efflux pump